MKFAGISPSTPKPCPRCPRTGEDRRVTTAQRIERLLHERAAAVGECDTPEPERFVHGYVVRRNNR